MKLLGLLNCTLPVLRKAQTCEACGQLFACEISLGKGCWCGEVTLSDETLQHLRATYRKCVCRSCLEKAETNSSMREMQGERL